MSIRHTAISILVSLWVGACSALPAMAAPAGAEMLPPERLYFSDDIVCGERSGEWLPGSLLTNGWFVSHTDHAEHFRQRAQLTRGRVRSKAMQKARQFTARARSESGACLDASQPGDLPPDEDAPPSEPPSDNPPGNEPPDGTGPFQINLNGAAGILLGRPDFAGGRLADSNLRTITPLGPLTNPFSTRRAVVNEIAVGPTGTTYMIFEHSIDLATGRISSDGCGFLGVRSSGSTRPFCVERDAHAIALPRSYSRSRLQMEKSPIQFDAAGNTYYAVWRNGQSYLRRFDGFAARDFLSRSVKLHDFLVLRDGSIVISEMDDTRSDRPLRLIDRNGDSIIIGEGETTFIRQLGDGRVYFATDNRPGVRAVLPSLSSPEVEYFIDDQGTHPCASLPMESHCGANMREMVLTGNGHTFALSGMSIPSKLYRLHPSPQPITTTLVNDVDFIAAQGRDLIIAGRAQYGIARIVRYDTTTRSERLLYESRSASQIHRISASNRTNRVIFEAMETSGHIVIGKIELDGARVTIEPSNDFDGLRLHAFE